MKINATSMKYFRKSWCGGNETAIKTSIILLYKGQLLKNKNVQFEEGLGESMCLLSLRP